MTKIAPRFKVLGMVIILFLIVFYFLGESTGYKETSIQKKEQKQEIVALQAETKPVFKGGYFRYNPQRIKLTSTPQRYFFNASGDWEFWYDITATGLPFNVQFSPDGEILDCKNPDVNHAPMGEIWVSKKPGNPDQYVNFSYSYSKDNKMNPLNR